MRRFRVQADSLAQQLFVAVLGFEPIERSVGDGRNCLHDSLVFSTEPSVPFRIVALGL